MKKRQASILSKTWKVMGGLLIIALTLLPLLSLYKTFNASALKNTFAHHRVESLEPLRVRDRDRKPINPYGEPVVSVTFDDGWETTYTNAMPVLQKYGIPTTQYIIAGEFNNPVYLSYDQAKRMHDAGHEIASHTMTHPDLTKLSVDEAAAELSNSKATLSTIAPVRDFAAPYGAWNAKTLQLISQYYRSNRLSDAPKTFNLEKDVNTTGNFDIYSIKAFAITRQTSLATFQQYIDYTVAHKGWLILAYHQVDDKQQDNYGVGKSAFEQQMKLLHDTPVRVATVGAFLDALDTSQRPGY